MRTYVANQTQNLGCNRDIARSRNYDKFKLQASHNCIARTYGRFTRSAQ
jgi:hypothetical protein